MSQLPDHPPTGEEYADSLAQLLDHLGVTRAHVAGMLTGGVVTLAFATRHPARTHCVMLQHTPLYSAEELERQGAAPPPDTRIWADGRHVTERWQARRKARKLDRASPEALQWQLVGTLLMGDPGGWWPDAGAGDYVSRSFDATRAVRELRAPTLVITLSEDGMIPHATRMMALRPDFERAALPVGQAMVP
jgi:pimeloyl-ACP methyl ester carboxylesterase